MIPLTDIDATNCVVHNPKGHRSTGTCDVTHNVGSLTSALEILFERPQSITELVRLAGFELPTLDSVGTFHRLQLGDYPGNMPQLIEQMPTRIQGS